jgi:hypothetical protein
VSSDEKSEKHNNNNNSSSEGTKLYRLNSADVIMDEGEDEKFECLMNVPFHVETEH